MHASANAPFSIIRSTTNQLFPLFGSSTRQRFFSELKSEGWSVVIGGDGRADSPGHLAKYGSYTVVELEKRIVMDVQLVQVGMPFTGLTTDYLALDNLQSNEVNRSYYMEKEGIVSAIQLLCNQAFEIGTLVTDRLQKRCTYIAIKNDAPT